MVKPVEAAGQSLKSDAHIQEAGSLMEADERVRPALMMAFKGDAAGSDPESPVDPLPLQRTLG